MKQSMATSRFSGRARNAQLGQAIVLIAILILVLFGMLGLAIDSGRTYVDRRDQQTAVDAAALAAGDWYENFQDVLGSAMPQAKQIYANNLHLYSSPASDNLTFAMVGAGNNLRQDTEVATFSGGYQLTIVATNTQFNGYQFTVSTVHSLPLAFMQVFGGPSRRHHHRDRDSDRRQPAPDAGLADAEHRQLRNEPQGRRSAHRPW